MAPRRVRPEGVTQQVWSFFMRASAMTMRLMLHVELSVAPTALGLPSLISPAAYAVG
jgi:hypothetical protein